MARKPPTKPVKPARKAKPDKKMGRPTKYDPDFHPDAAMRLCRMGAINTEIAEFFGISNSTLFQWRDTHEAFAFAIKQGKTHADLRVADALFHRATGYSHPAVKIMLVDGQPMSVPYIEHYPPDSTSMIFWLKNRRPDLWREKVEDESDSKRPIVINFDFSGKPQPVVLRGPVQRVIEGNG